MVFLLDTPESAFAHCYRKFLNKIRAFLLCSLCLFFVFITLNPMQHAAAQKDQNQNTASQKESTLSVSDMPYLFKANDIINIKALGEPELSRSYLSDHNGMILIPWIGKVQVEGRTASQIEADITAKLKDGYLKNPIISISQYSPLSIGKTEFYIMGEIQNPGRYDLPNAPPFLLKAIAIAGGFTSRANQTNFEIIRHINGTNYKIKNNSANTMIQSGDVIVVNAQNTRILNQREKN